MNKIQKHLTDVMTDDLSGIWCDEITSRSSNYRKINVYNKHVDIPQHKVWIAAPYMRLAKPVFPPNSKFTQSMPLTVHLTRDTMEHRKFNRYVMQLEKKIGTIIRNNTKNNIEPNVKHKIEQLNKNNSNYIHKSSIKDYNGYKNLSVNIPFTKIGDCYEFSIKIYNKKNKAMSLVNIPQGSKVLMYIALSEVWVSDTKYGFNWIVLQMKVFPELDLSICYFDEDDEDVDESKQTECYHCLYCPNMHVRTHCCTSVSTPVIQYVQQQQPVMNNNNNSVYVGPSLPPPPPPPILKQPKPIMLTGFAPSVNDILSVKLKPVKIIKDINNDVNSDCDSIDTEEELDVIKCMLKSKENKENLENNEKFPDLLSDSED